MERLTFEHDGKKCFYCGDEDGSGCECKVCFGGCAVCNPCPVEQTVIDRLAAYEDSGLEPDVVKELGDHIHKSGERLLSALEHAQRLLEAEEAGRLVVLPCKIGEMWDFEDGKTMEILGFHIDRWAGLSVLHCVDGDDPEDDDSLRSCNPTYFLAHFTRHEAEAAMEKGADT